MSAQLEARELVKHFARVKAVNGVSFAIRPGICFGLLGPNGAGKTTTVEMLEGISQPTRGQVLYEGEPLGPRFRREAGIMFQRTALQEFITVRETLALFQDFYAHTTPLETLIEQCALEDFLERDTRKLSGGQRQRLLLAIALVNDPKVLFLDEPTNGLDPQARRNFWSLVERIKARGKTIVLTTHYMEEAYLLCEEIAIVDGGRLIAHGAPRRLLAEHFQETVLELPSADVPRTLDGGLAAVRRDEVVEVRAHDVNVAVAALIDQGVSLSHLRVREMTLEDLFLDLTGKELRA